MSGARHRRADTRTPGVPPPDRAGSVSGAEMRARNRGPVDRVRPAWPACRVAGSGAGAAGRRLSRGGRPARGPAALADDARVLEAVGFAPWNGASHNEGNPRAGGAPAVVRARCRSGALPRAGAHSATVAPGAAVTTGLTARGPAGRVVGSTRTPAVMRGDHDERTSQRRTAALRLRRVRRGQHARAEQAVALVQHRASHGGRTLATATSTPTPSARAASSRRGAPASTPTRATPSGLTGPPPAPARPQTEAGGRWHAARPATSPASAAGRAATAGGRRRPA